MAIKKISNNKKRRLADLSAQAMNAIAQGQLETAQSLCSRADDEYKNFPDTMYVRGLIAIRKSDFPLAIDWLTRASQAAPKRLEFKTNLAGSMLLGNQEEDAAILYKQVLAQSPRSYEALFGYATALELMGELRHALEMYEKASQLFPRDVDIIQKLAHIHNYLINTETSMALMEKAHTLAPKNDEILYNMAINLSQHGNKEEAMKRLNEALALNPNNIDSLLLLFSNFPTDKENTHFTKLKSIYAQSQPGSYERISSAFILGHIADKTGQYEQAFDYWRKANQQRRRHFINYDENEQESLHIAASVPFPKERFADAIPRQASQANPIFIIGMPRCGSTLLEQALSRHPALQTVGETDAIPQSMIGRHHKLRNNTLMELLSTLNNSELLAIGHEYERRLTDEYSAAGRVIDKGLINYLYAGVIAKALPHARIIHIRREPMATCLSMFRENFSSSVYYSFDLDELGRQYARYQRIMQHWRSVLPAGFMLEVGYEELVSTPEPVLRKLLQDCNLEWSDACLNSHQGTGPVSTASVLQVREPIHQKSVAHWQHYEKQLAPLHQYFQT
ncbi:MAG: sulfotransferase [Mariprofundus sp.]|nr:sulfotransferase [Mariprofundus sp.]